MHTHKHKHTRAHTRAIGLWLQNELFGKNNTPFSVPAVTRSKCSMTSRTSACASAGVLLDCACKVYTVHLVHWMDVLNLLPTHGLTSICQWPSSALYKSRQHEKQMFWFTSAYVLGFIPTYMLGFISTDVLSLSPHMREGISPQMCWVLSPSCVRSTSIDDSAHFRLWITETLSITARTKQTTSHIHVGALFVAHFCLWLRKTLSITAWTKTTTSHIHVGVLLLSFDHSKVWGVGACKDANCRDHYMHPHLRQM